MEVFNSGFEICSFDDLPQKNVALDSKTPTEKNYIEIEKIRTNPHIFAEEVIEDLKQRFLSTKRTFIVAFSGGKDSTCVLQLVYTMLFNLPKSQRRQTYAIASNTLVEAPHIEDFLLKVIESVNAHAKLHKIPFEVLQVTPSLKDDFWVNLIGKGYPSPTRTFRWCTDRLKITPTKDIVAQITQKYGSALLILGTRKSESTNRKKSMERRLYSELGYSQHNDFPNTLTYAPIAEWTTDEVWAYLSANKPLWEKDHSELFALYAKASSDECQFITDLSQKSCGGSRFGCWVCTVVNEDKSMQGFIDNGDANLKPLNDFRNYLKSLREDPSARADYGRNGRAVYKVGGLGPFLSHIRKEIFKKLLQAEQIFIQNGGRRLINDKQIMAIQNEWNKDFDFTQSAITLAKEVGRMKLQSTNANKVLHEELLSKSVDECGKNFDNHLNVESIKNLINACINIYHNSSLRGRNSAGKQMRDEIEKLLSDETSKRVESNVY